MPQPRWTALVTDTVLHFSLWHCLPMAAKRTGELGWQEPPKWLPKWPHYVRQATAAKPRGRILKKIRGGSNRGISRCRHITDFQIFPGYRTLFTDDWIYHILHANISDGRQNTVYSHAMSYDLSIDSKEGSRMVLLQSDKAHRGRKSGWMDGPLQQGTLSQGTAVHHLSISTKYFF